MNFIFWLILDKKFDELIKSDNLDIKTMQSLYAAADELHVKQNCPISENQLASRRGIEIGHIFNFGDKYSKAMNAKVTGADGKDIYPQMGSYGIGVSRLVAAIIESSHDENGIIWPKSVAPFDCVIINVKAGDEKSDQECEKLYQTLKENNIETLLDDRKVGLGQKFAVSDLIGIPTQIIIGPNSIKDNKAQIKDRKTGEKKEIDLDKIYTAPH